MASFETNITDAEVNSKKLEGQKNPLSGKVEEVQAKFDALPLLVKVKLEELISELNTKLSNVENTADKDKLLSEDGIAKVESLKKELEGYINSLANTVEALRGKHDEDVTRIEESIAQRIAELVGQAPETLDTLAEIAAALGDNANSVTEILRQIGTKADKKYVEGMEDRVIVFEGEMYEVKADLMYTKEDVVYISEILKNLDKLFATKEEVDGIKTYVEEQIGEALEGDY